MSVVKRGQVRALSVRPTPYGTRRTTIVLLSLTRSFDLPMEISRIVERHSFGLKRGRRRRFSFHFVVITVVALCNRRFKLILN